jgi:ABC-type Zn uptake system ZnuABC Zn-binding protein ZnuA
MKGGWWVLLGLLSLAMGACMAGVPSNPSKLKVAASIPPLADFVRQVGGDRVEVELLVAPGSSVHTYEPTPRQVQFLAGAQLLVLNGLSLEFWADDLVHGLGRKAPLVVDTSRGILGLAEEEGGPDPHIWLDPSKAQIQVENIRDSLIQVDPAGAEVYRKRATQYIERLQALDREILSRTRAWQRRRFIAFHSAWRYFATRYGLEQVTVIEEFPGKEPSPQYLAEVVRKARALEAGAIFAESQLSPKAAQTIAAEAGKEVLILDVLGGVPGRTTYINLMRYNVDQMEKALR